MKQFVQNPTHFSVDCAQKNGQCSVVLKNIIFLDDGKEPAAVDYLQGLGMGNIAAWEARLLEYATARLNRIEGFRMVGTAANKAGVMSFVLGDIHANDVGTLVDLHGVAIRTGHHCAMPVVQFFGLPATARASLGVYNTFEEVDVLAEALQKTALMFA